MGCTPAHVVAVVASTMVIGDEPGIGFGLELADGAEVTAVEGRTPALLEDGLVEALDRRVVIGRASRDPLVTESLAGRAGGTGSSRRRPQGRVSEDGPDPYPMRRECRPTAPGR